MPSRSATPKLAYRSLPLRSDSSAPSSLNLDSRSVEVVGATEEPVEIFDPIRWEVVKEILLMDGCEIPASRQITLHDSHQRVSTASVLGSFRDMRVERGQLLGRAFFSTAPEAENPWTKVAEGHITDFSIGYRQIETAWIKEGETAVIGGRSFKGPVRVTARWRPKELSVVPVGADELAKARGAAAPPTPTATPSHSEETEMNKRLRQILISRGLAEAATDEEAWAFFDQIADQLLPAERAAAAPQAPQPPPDADRIRAQAAGEERGRIVEIDAMCRQFDVPRETADRFVAEGVSVDAARKQVLDLLIQRSPRTPPAPAVVVADERDKFRAAVEDALLIRSGVPAAQPQQAAPGARDIAGWTLVEIARRSLRLAGQPVNGSRMEMVGRAMISSDFPLLLANTAHKTLFAGWEAADETWNTWCGTGSVSDFKTHSMPRPSETDDLLEVPEHGEYKYGERTEAQEQYQIVTYGRLFAITRQAIINDDLSALSDIPARHGEAARRKIGDVAWAVLTGNANMGDGVALFHANHSNLGSSAVIGVTSLAEGIKLMGLQKDILGKRRLNIRPIFVLAPKAVEGAAEVFFNSMQYSAQEASTRHNPYAGSYFTRVYEPRLDDASATAWYLSAAKGKTVTVFFLDGIQTPYLEQQGGWKVDGVEFKVRIDCGAKAVDWRGLFKNAGA